MSFIKEFKEFAVKGNVIDMAVGIIIGSAFGKIVNSVINDLIMPLVAGILGAPDFSNLYVPLRSDVPKGVALADAQAIGPVFAYGNFITEVLNFVILAFAIFMMVKAINRLKKKQEEAPAAAPEPPKQEQLLAEIRDLLKNR
jgi:large conductance mechanosensitive channel